MPLRPYQRAALDAVKENYANGVSRQLIVCPTGGGKTVIAAHIPKTVGMRRGEQMVFVVHRNDLADQSVRQFRKWNPDLKITLDRAKHRPDMSADIIIASAQTIGKLNEGDPDLFSERIHAYDPGRVRYVQVDEVHIAPGSETILQILRYFKVYKSEPENNDPSKLLTCFTATPERTDGVGLDTICDKIVFGDTYGLREMVNDGWLTRIAGYRVETETSLDSVKTRHGDFQIADLETTVNTPERNRLVVEKYKELGNGRPAIAFTVDIQHAHDLSIEFRKHGIVAAPVSGRTTDDERQRIYRGFRDREITVMLSAGVFNVGFDAPWAEIALMTAPTMSGLLYRQRVGRVLRPYPAPEEHAKPIKEKAVIIDFCDLCYRHRLISMPSLFGLNKDFDLAGSDAVKVAEEVEDLQEQKQLSLGSFRSMQELRSLVESIDLLAPPQVPEEIKALSRYAWLSGLNGFRLSVPGRIIFSVREDSLGRYSVYKNVDGLKQTVYDGIVSLDESIKLADGLVPADAKRVLLMDAGWRREKPTDKQISALARLDRAMVNKFGSFPAFKEFVEGNFTRGQVSSMISDRQRN